MSAKTPFVRQTSLLSQLETHQTLSEMVKHKDYNKVLSRIKTYQTLALTLDTPINKAHQVHSSTIHLRDIDVQHSQIQLAIDELVEDTESIGYQILSEVFNAFGHLLNIIHESITRGVKDKIEALHNEEWKVQKNLTSLCRQCKLSHQAVHLKSLKREYGVLSAQEAVNEAMEALEQDQDLAYKERADFLDQITFLLQKKDKIASISLSNRKIQELMRSLEHMQKTNERTKNNYSKKGPYQDNIQREERLNKVDTKYGMVVAEIKEILNSKFQENYSARIKGLLEKYENAILRDKTQKVEKKKYVNIIETGVQTQYTPETVQIDILRGELNLKEKEVQGVKQGRNQVDNHYMNILERQRKQGKQLGQLTYNYQKLLLQLVDTQREVDQQKKLNQQLHDYIEQMTLNKHKGAVNSLMAKSPTRPPTSKSRSERERQKSMKKIQQSIMDSINSRKMIKAANDTKDFWTQTVEEISIPKREPKMKRQVSRTSVLVPTYADLNLGKALSKMGLNDQTSSLTLEKAHDLKHESKNVQIQVEPTRVERKTAQSLPKSKPTPVKQNLLEEPKHNSIKKKTVKKVNSPSLSNPSQKELKPILNRPKTKQQKARVESSSPTVTSPPEDSGSQVLIDVPEGIIEQAQEESHKPSQVAIESPEKETTSKKQVDRPSKRSSIPVSQKLSLLATQVKKEERRASRQFKNISMVRLTELNNSKSIRYNHSKTPLVKTREDVLNANNKENSGAVASKSTEKVRINKYERRDSGTGEKEKVKEIVSLLSGKKDFIVGKPSKFKTADKLEEEKSAEVGKAEEEVRQPSVKKLTRESEHSEEIVFTKTCHHHHKMESGHRCSRNVKAERDSIRNTRAQFQKKIESWANSMQENSDNDGKSDSIPAQISEVKALIESDFTYFKATGLIDYLKSLKKNPSQADRKKARYDFKFTHISLDDLVLFGGNKSLVQYSKGTGPWEEKSSGLRVDYENSNFAVKISKYVMLLKKINYQFFLEYFEFITKPIGFIRSHFDQKEVMGMGLGECKDVGWLPEEGEEGACRKIVSRVMKYHQEAHGECQHLTQFLEKIGYYRYAL